MFASEPRKSREISVGAQVMHMLAGSKEFLLFRPNQIKNLHYESVPEIRYDDSSNGPGARAILSLSLPPTCPALLLRFGLPSPVCLLFLWFMRWRWGF